MKSKNLTEIREELTPENWPFETEIIFIPLVDLYSNRPPPIREDWILVGVTVNTEEAMFFNLFGREKSKMNETELIIQRSRNAVKEVHDKLKTIQERINESRKRIQEIRDSVSGKS